MTTLARSTRPLRAGVFLMASLATTLVACGDDEAETRGAGGGGGATTSSGASTSSVTSSGGETVTSSGGSGEGGAGGEGGTGGHGAAGGAGQGGGAEGGGGAAPIEPGLTILDLAMPIDLTSDGRVALLQDGASPEADVYFYDVVADDVAYATSMGDALADFATGLSDDRVVSGLHGLPVEAGVWASASDWTDLASPFPEACDINVGGAWDVSRDGGVAVGFFWNVCSPQAFRFERDSGDVVLLDVLGAPFDGEDRPASNRATVISDDGRVAAGFAENDVLDRSAAVWTDDGAGFLLDPDGQDAPSEVLAISTDGSVLGGVWGYDVFRWTEVGGIELLPRLDSALPGDPMFLNALARDGDLAFGGSGDAFSGIPVAYVWSDASGTRPIQDIAVAAGIEIPEGFIFNNVLATSADGSVVLGVGMDADFATKSFVLRLPPAAYDE